MSKKPDYTSIQHLWQSMAQVNNYIAVDHLWQALPSVYRERDEKNAYNEGGNNDLRLYLEAIAVVLDQVKRNLDQRLRDTSPLTCQSWLLPYFADMLDVRLLSPDIEGQRQEIANAVRWRQRKGTVAVCVEIAEAVGQMPIIAYEGHNSVATTARPGYRKPTMKELGEPPWEDTPKTPSHMSERPGTPAVTVDFRKQSSPFRVDKNKPTPLSMKSRFGDEEVVWQHENAPHGVSCHQEDGYRDVSMRTVDMRTPDWRDGHHHPKRLRLYTPVPKGFIKAEHGSGIKEETVKFVMTPMAPPDDSAAWEESKGKHGYRFFCRQDENTHPLTVDSVDLEYVCIEERHLPASADANDNISRDLIIRRTLITQSDEERQLTKLPGKWETVWQENDYLLQWERHFDQKKGIWHTQIRGGTWDMVGGKQGNAGMSLAGREHLKEEKRWPTLLNKIAIDRPPEKDVIIHHVVVKQLVLPDEFSVDAECLSLSGVAAKKLMLKLDNDLLPATTQSTLKPAHLKATDSLIQDFDATGLVVELEYCTVNTDWKCSELRASDSILLGTFDGVDTLRLRYSCAPQLLQKNEWIIHKNSVHSHPPEFYHQNIDSRGNHKLDESAFGQPGYGVLHQGAHPDIRHGAENGGELGAYHHRHYCGRQDAVAEKLFEFLPVGIKPVLIVDPYWKTPVERPKKKEDKSEGSDLTG